MVNFQPDIDALILKNAPNGGMFNVGDVGHHFDPGINDSVTVFKKRR